MFKAIQQGGILMKRYSNPKTVFHIACSREPIRHMRLLVVFLTAVWLAGCQSDPSIKAQSPSVMESDNTISCSPGDQVEIKFPYAAEFNEVQVIRPDGKMELPLIGEVVAAGKSPSQLRADLMQAYAQHLTHPELSVMVRSAYERRVYVGGAVKEPGLVDMPGSMTALEAIMQAGGFDHSTASVEDVIVIRYENGQRCAYSLNFGETDEGGKGFAPFFLEPRDVIYVPRTTIAKVDQWIDQHVWQLLPRVNFGYGIGGNN